MRVPGGWDSQLSRQSIREGGKVVRPEHRPPLHPRKYSWYSFLLEAVNPRAIVRPEELCQKNIPMTPLGIEPATFRLVAQYFNQLRYRVPRLFLSSPTKIMQALFISPTPVTAPSDSLPLSWKSWNCSAVPTLPRQRQVAVTVWQIPDAVDTVVCSPDDGWWYHPKHVEQFPDKIICVTLHLVGYILEYSYDAGTHES